MSGINGTRSSATFEVMNRQMATAGGASTRATANAQQLDRANGVSALRGAMGDSQAEAAGGAFSKDSLGKVLELLTSILSNLMTLISSMMGGAQPTTGEQPEDVSNALDTSGSSTGASSGSDTDEPPSSGTTNSGAAAGGSTTPSTGNASEEAPATGTPATNTDTSATVEQKPGGVNNKIDVAKTPVTSIPVVVSEEDNKAVERLLKRREEPLNPTQNLQAIQSDTGEINVRTKDGYEVRFEAKDMAWVITGPDGKSTRIWGDPHVNESDGEKWDFTKRGTFQFGENKATVEVVPWGENGQTVSARVTIYSGNERVTISGIDQNKPVITAAAQDGKQHDDALDDGDLYRREVTATGEEWMNAEAKPMA